jgi:tRNA threonylcarbamoyladenosine biosynthesis protein TsaE
MEKVIETGSPEETRLLGEKIGKLLPPGAVVLLIGDLGSGKTCFAQGLGRGLEVDQQYYITSPTYTMVNEYRGRHPFYHMDLYRLRDSMEMEDIGIYDMLWGEGVTAIEWGEKVLQDLPDHITVRIESISDQIRRIFISGTGQLMDRISRQLNRQL